ncbi:ABC transporter permease [Oscillospiraceae bacterium LCP25S3_E10]|nr:ABC transporter permease [Ruminococcus sp.]MDD6447605.1 ABC transporter permease [Ruminococcus sp.]MDY2856323.1 ABC transporter permease [Oscillospiraceae bacterium]
MSAIYKRELNAYFTSPIAYVVYAVAALFGGMFFMGTVLTPDTTDMTYVFLNMTSVVIILIPILTMRLFSEEKNKKTEQGLLTAPVNLFQIVMGKYLAAVTVYAIMLVLFVIYGIIISFFAAPSWITIISNIIGLLLFGMALISIGTFVSSLTESQIVAAIISIGVGLLISYMDSLASSVNVDFIKTILSAISFTTPYQNFAVGIIKLSDVVFFLSVPVLFNFLTVRVLERRRWN